MRFHSRGIIILIALFTLTSTLLAQAEPIRVVGSGIAQPVLQALAEASGSEANLNFEVTGTTAGFTAFCGGQAEVTTASRAIQAAESANCSANNITYFEILLAEDIAVLVANPALDTVTCLTGDQVSQIFAPSAQATTTTWAQVIEGSTDVPLTVFAPTDNTSTYAILDRLVEGDGLRADATLLTGDLAEAIGSAPGAVGVVKQSDAFAAGDAVKILDLDAAEISGCRTPNADNVENDLYPLADRLYAYVNLSALGTPGLNELLEYVTSDTAVSIIEEQGFAAPTANALQENRDVLQAAISGEPVVSTTSTDFIAPTGLSGTINIGGAAVGFTFLQDSTSGFNASNPDITVSTNIEGQIAGFRRFCNGELDLVAANRDLADE
ncbi:MAG: substrate-binding domain-containing protein, partial [Anaerolineae bacterium]|nr:substrate-binding domain-containing protein [Anaerolineae bacterium]